MVRGKVSLKIEGPKSKTEERGSRAAESTTHAPCATEPLTWHHDGMGCHVVHRDGSLGSCLGLDLQRTLLMYPPNPPTQRDEGGAISTFPET